MTSNLIFNIRGAFFPDVSAAESISASTDEQSDRAPSAMPAAPAFANAIAVAVPTPFEAPVMKM